MNQTSPKTDLMTLGKRGEELIKSYEQLRLEAYLPTPDDVWTIGFGSTRAVSRGMKITIEQAEERFEVDTHDAIMAVSRLPVNLTQSMFDALVSLVFNVGPGCVSAASTIGKALRSGDYYGAWAGFTLWRKQAGKDLLGLARRRSREMVLFLEDGIPR